MTCSTPRQQAAFEALHRAPAAATSACTPPPTPSTTGRGTASWSAPGSTRTRPPAGDRRVEDRANPSTAHLPSTWTRTDEWYNYRTNPRETVKVLASLDESSYTGGLDGRGPPDHLVPELRRRPLLVHRPRPHRGVLHRPELHTASCSAASRWRPGGRGRLPSRDRLHRRCSTAPRPASSSGGRRGRAGSRLADGTLTSFGGMGLLWYPVSTFSNYSLKVDWQMPGDDNGGVFIGFPDPQRRPVGPGQRRPRDPDRRHRRRPVPHHRQRLQLQGPRPGHPRRGAQPARPWNTYEIGVHGQRVEIWLNGVKINDYTSSRAIANGYIGCRTTAPEWTSTTATCGSGPTVGEPPVSDLAQGRPVTASSVEPGSAHAAANAVDGRRRTRWGSAYADPQWITSTSAPRTRSTGSGSTGRRRTRRRTRSRCRRTTTAWIDVYTTTTGDGGVDDSPDRHRPIRAGERDPARHPMGLLAVGRQRLRHPGRPRAQSLSPGNAGDRVQRRVGQPARRRERRRRQRATRWGSAYADPQWISVDLGASRTLDRVRLTWEAAYGAGVPGPGVPGQRHLDRHATPRPPATAASTTSPSRPPVATCGSRHPAGPARVRLLTLGAGGARQLSASPEACFKSRVARGPGPHLSGAVARVPP